MSALSIAAVDERHEGPRTRPALRVVEAPRRRRARPVRGVRRPAPARVRLTRRGRALVTLAFLLVTLAVMVAVGGWATATLTGGTPDPVRIVEVRPGQTLYDIAGTVARPGHIREMVYRIQELNSLPTAQITEGQKLAVPQG